MTLKAFVESGKQVVTIAGQAIHWAEHKKEKEAREHFEHGKQEFFMRFVIQARSPTVIRPAYRPMPGTTEFAYCESLVKDGLLERDIITGHYMIKVGTAVS